ncbi:MAG: ABC transporter ATP-binding protein [Oscillospiraceae bacterium]|nr:ABC transporter ATP-binding protein [Oscillospiraceae bacterium]
MDKTIISADGLSVGYGRKVIVDGIEFEVKQGEILTLIGPNGAGKSTVLKTIAGYLKRLDGTVMVGNRDMLEFSEKEMAKKLSVVLTERISPELMTCREVVETGRYPYTGSFGLLTEKDRAVVENAIEKVSMQDYADVDFSSVSDGQRQRVMLARAICQEPEILILDEPTSYLDIHHKIQFLEILRSLAKEKQMAVILSMHELDFAEKISDYVLCIKGGKITLSGTLDKVFTAENIMGLYDIPEKLYHKYFG